jgi:hypothetical protein
MFTTHIEWGVSGLWTETIGTIDRLEGNYSHVFDGAVADAKLEGGVRIVTIPAASSMNEEVLP